MINLTATTESNPQTIAVWQENSGDYYWQLKCVAWISQNVDSAKTTIYYKWQIYQWNYWLSSDGTHTYTLSLGGISSSVSFGIPFSNANGLKDMCSAQKLGTFDHTNGDFSGTFSFSGYYYPRGSFSYQEPMTLPSITVPTEPDPQDQEPDPPVPIERDNNPRFYIYADSELVYGPGIDGYEILNPKLSLEVNKSGSLEFDIPVGSVMYNRLNLMKTTIEVRQGNEILFRGRVLSSKRNIRNTLTYYCEGFLSWFVDIVFIPAQKFNGQGRDLLKNYIRRYNSRAAANRQITYVYSDVSAKITVEHKDYSTAWAEIKKNLIDGIGGYLVPYLTSEMTGLQWLTSFGTSTSQVIQFGENLLDFSEYIDASGIFNAVRPFGKEENNTRISLSENEGFVTDTGSINTYGRIERTVFFDEITSTAALKSAAQTYLRTGLNPAVTLSLKAVDLHLLDVNVERIRLGDSVRVISVPHSIDAHFLCTKIEYDLAHPQNTVFTFGSTQRTISEMTDSSYNKYVITEGA